MAATTEHVEHEHTTEDGFFLPEDWHAELAEVSDEDLQRQIAARMIELALREDSTVIQVALSFLRGTMEA